MDDLGAVRSCLEWIPGARARCTNKRLDFYLAAAGQALAEVEHVVSTGGVLSRTPNLAGLAEGIYAEYPRKVGRDKALEKISKAIKKIASSKTKGDELAAALWLLDRVKTYASSPHLRGRELEFIPHCATWMNGGRYDDPLTEWGYTARDLGLRKFRALSPERQAEVRRLALEASPHTTDPDGAIASWMSKQEVQV